MSVKYDGPVFTLAPEGQRVAPPPLGAAISPVLPKPAEKTLANGLRVIVARSSDLPLVTADLTVKAGAWTDPKGLSGTAGMTANMLSEGTKTRSAQEIARQVEALGANLDTGANLEASSVTLNVMPDKLTAALPIMADVARNPAFKPDELERQRQQALDGLQVAYQEPGAIAGFAIAPVVFGGTPFGHVTVGTPASIARLKPADLTAIHAAWYRPDNAVLVLTGDITPEQGFAYAEQAFGDWKRPATPLAPAPTITPALEPRVIAIDLPGAGQASVNVTKASIARSDPSYYTALVANTVLGGGYSARLNQEIRVKRGLSYGASARFAANRTTGVFRAGAQTKNESAPVVLGLIDQQMKGMAAAPPKPEELTARKSTLVGSFGRELATTGGLADILGNLALYGVPLDEVKVYTSKVEAVTGDQVQSFAGKMLDPANASVLVVGDAKSFAGPLKAARPKLEVIPASQLDLDNPTLRKGAK
jgi:zinc protease